MKSLSFVNGPLTDTEGAKAVAKHIFDYYNKNRSNELSHQEIQPMLVDAYKAMSKSFNPS